MCSYIISRTTHFFSLTNIKLQRTHSFQILNKIDRYLMSEYPLNFPPAPYHLHITGHFIYRNKNFRDILVMPSGYTFALPAIYILNNVNVSS